MKRLLLIIVAILTLISCDNSTIENEPTYNITYNNNGSDSGSVPEDKKLYKSGTKAPILGNTGNLIKTSYTFKCWNTNQDGTGTDYKVGSSIDIKSDDIILYAKWEKSPEFSVIYKGNGSDGGEVPADTGSYEEGEDITVISKGTMTRKGHTFNGWNTSEDGNGTDRAVNTRFKMGTQTITLYAKWEINKYRITYNPNNSTDGTAPSTVEYDYNSIAKVSGNTGNLKNTPTPGSAEAFKFIGWNTEDDGTGTDYAVGDTFSMPDKNIVLYAKWGIFELRDNGPAGGWVFYDKGSFTDGWRYLEAERSDLGFGQKWSPVNELTNISSTVVGSGKSNTNTMLGKFGSGSQYSAERCDKRNSGGYSDWFLPSKDELNLIYINLKSHDIGSIGNYVYWSSTEVNTTRAWSQNMGTGAQNSSQYKISGTSSIRIRAVRAF